MKTEIVPASESAGAVELLRAGNIVALPTETVYGLAADALNPDAVARIFEAKERPRFDPLIVHVPDSTWLEKVANVSTQDRQLVSELIGHFWPGPFTLVLARKPIIPDIVTAGLDTVAVRLSAHPVFRSVIQSFGGPLAAPSANRFGRISPTAAAHVADELEGRIPLIIDGGPTNHGLESTIVRIKEGRIEILRRGPITKEQLSEFGQVEIADGKGPILAPGQLPSHYAPRTPLVLIDNARDFEVPEGKAAALLAWHPAEGTEKFAVVRRLSEAEDLREAATNLFRYLRELDALNVDLIVAERVPEEGLGAAIMDRLSHAENRGAGSGLI